MMEMEKEIGNQVQLFIWRIPKKNHEAMVELQKQFNDLLIRHGVLRMEIFQLTNTEAYDGCTNIGYVRSYEGRRYERRGSPCETVYGSRDAWIWHDHGKVHSPQNLGT